MDILNAKQLKEQASITSLLDHLGYKPARKSGKEQMYLSMLRDSDTKPSLSVNDELGMWFDHGSGKGGNIIDLGLALWPALSFDEVILKLQDSTHLTQPGRTMRPRKPVKIPHYKIEQTKDIGTHPAITEYLKSRCIFDIAKSSMKEVYYYVEDDKKERKYFFAAGWQNENGGWEVRNKYFKGCLGHKGITFIPGDEKKLSVFEGYINYLSWKVENPAINHSILILNTLSMLTVGIGKAIQFPLIDIYFDRDKAGYLCAMDFIKALPYATDKSGRFNGYNDYNDKLVATVASNYLDIGGTRKLIR